MTIVHPDTLRRWIREDKRGKRSLSGKPGRRRTGDEIRRLILKLAKANNWGYTRILGELRKLNIRAVSRNTVKNVLKENGYDPGPQRGHGTWDEFLKIHAATLWQCDFVSKRIVTPKGVRDAFLLVFLHVETRRVFISPATCHPNAAWVNEQATAFLKQAKCAKLGAEIMMHDRDTKFAGVFDTALEDAGWFAALLEVGRPDRAVERQHREPRRVPSPILGPMTRAEWDQLHLRHAELHLSFFVSA